MRETADAQKIDFQKCKMPLTLLPHLLLGSELTGRAIEANVTPTTTDSHITDSSPEIQSFSCKLVPTLALPNAIFAPLPLHLGDADRLPPVAAAHPTLHPS